MASAVEAAPCPAAVRRQPLRWRRVVLGMLSVLALAAGIEIYRVTFGSNFHTVVDGRVYRCAQPSATELDQMIAQLGIRTVVNMRGNGDIQSWYVDETRTTHRHNVSQEDICFSAGRLPSVPELHRLLEVLDKTEYPILLHCRRGADRTGLAAAIVVLLSSDGTIQNAR